MCAPTPQMKSMCVMATCSPGSAQMELLNDWRTKGSAPVVALPGISENTGAGEACCSATAWYW